MRDFLESATVEAGGAHLVSRVHCDEPELLAALREDSSNGDCTLHL